MCYAIDSLNSPNLEYERVEPFLKIDCLFLPGSEVQNVVGKLPPPTECVHMECALMLKFGLEGVNIGTKDRHCHNTSHYSLAFTRRVCNISKHMLDGRR